MKRTTAIMSLLLGTFLILAGSGLSACNTIKGAGQDIKSAGEAIERTARQATPR